MRALRSPFANMLTDRESQIYSDMLSQLGIPLTPPSTPKKKRLIIRVPIPLQFQMERYPMLPSYDQLKNSNFKSMYTPYKRMTHWTQHINQICGRGGTYSERKRNGAMVKTVILPPEILGKCRAAMVDVNDPDCYFQVRHVLKHWKKPKLYKHIFSIIRLLGGKTIHIPYYVESQMQNDFIKICYQFEKRKPFPGRKNFISYYVLIKLLFQKWQIQPYYNLPSVYARDKLERLVTMYNTLNSLIGKH